MYAGQLVEQADAASFFAKRSPYSIALLEAMPPPPHAAIGSKPSPDRFRRRNSAGLPLYDRCPLRSHRAHTPPALEPCDDHLVRCPHARGGNARRGLGVSAMKEMLACLLGRSAVSAFTRDLVWLGTDTDNNRDLVTDNWFVKGDDTKTRVCFEPGDNVYFLESDWVNPSTQLVRTNTTAWAKEFDIGSIVISNDTTTFTWKCNGATSTLCVFRRPYRHVWQWCSGDPLLLPVERRLHRTWRAVHLVQRIILSRRPP